MAENKMTKEVLKAAKGTGSVEELHNKKYTMNMWKF